MSGKLTYFKTAVRGCECVWHIVHEVKFLEQIKLILFRTEACYQVPLLIPSLYKLIYITQFIPMSFYLLQVVSQIIVVQ